MNQNKIKFQSGSQNSALNIPTEQIKECSSDENRTTTIFLPLLLPAQYKRST